MFLLSDIYISQVFYSVFPSPKKGHGKVAKKKGTYSVRQCGDKQRAPFESGLWHTRRVHLSTLILTPVLYFLCNLLFALSSISMFQDSLLPEIRDKFLFLTLL